MIQYTHKLNQGGFQSMKKFKKKLTLLLLAGFFFLHTNGIYADFNNEAFNDYTVNPYSIDESLDDEHTAY